MIVQRIVGLAVTFALVAAACGGGGDASDGPGCYIRPFGTGCEWVAGGGAECTGQTVGSCPSAGLLGCCVNTTGSVEGANCLYQAALASAAESSCTGPGMKWQTSAP